MYDDYLQLSELYNSAPICVQAPVFVVLLEGLSRLPLSGYNLNWLKCYEGMHGSCMSRTDSAYQLEESQ